MKTLILLHAVALLLLLLGDQAMLTSSQTPNDQCDVCMAFSSNYSFLIHHLLTLPVHLHNCEELSRAVLNRTSNLTAFKTSETLCNSVGLKNFSQANHRSQKNPMMFCKLIGECGDAQEGDAKILSVEIEPPVIPHGSPYKIIVTFQTQNGTNDGNAYLELDNRENPYPFLASIALKAKPPGIYKVTWNLNASYDPNCPEHCFDYPAGLFYADIDLCSGRCDQCPQCKFYDHVDKVFTVVHT